MKSLLTTVLVLSASVSAFADHTQFERKPVAATTAPATKASVTPVKAEPHSRSYPAFIGSSKSAPKVDASIKPAVRRTHSRAYDRT